MKGRNIPNVRRPVGADSFCEANPGLSPWADDFRTFGAPGMGSTFNHTRLKANSGFASPVCAGKLQSARRSAQHSANENSDAREEIEACRIG